MTMIFQNKEIKDKRAARKQINQYLKEMHIVSKCVTGNLIFYMDLNKNYQNLKKELDLKKEKKLIERSFASDKFWKLSGNFNAKGYYWNHCGPSVEEFFFNAFFSENNEHEKVRFYFKGEFSNLDLILNAFIDVLNSDFDFPVGGIDIAITEIVSLKITPDNKYYDNIKKLINFILSDLFNHNGIM